VQRTVVCYRADGGNLAKLQAAVEYDGFIAYMLEI
jgi:hypothetical protein